jgi:hypothetical protein
LPPELSNRTGNQNVKTNPNVKLKREGINPSEMEKLDITFVFVSVWFKHG